MLSDIYIKEWLHVALCSLCMYSGDMELTKKIIFLLVVVAVATAAKKESEAVSTSGVNYGDSALVTLMKTEVNCVKNQLAVCKSLLIRASQLCKICMLKFFIIYLEHSHVRVFIAQI